MKSTRRVTIAAAFAAAALGTSLGAASLSAEESDFILRAPAAEAEEIAARNGLAILDQIEIAAGPDRHGLFRVRAPEGASPATVISTIEELEPTVLGIEPVTRASLPELDQSTMGILDQSVMAILDGVMDTHALVPPIGQVGPGHLGEPGVRTIKKIKIKDGGKYGYRDAKLVFQMQDDENRSRQDVSLRADFSPGCSVEFNRAVPPPVEGAAELEFDHDEVTWEITNHTDSPLTVSRVDVEWPAANLGLEEAELVVEAEQLFDPPSASFDFTGIGEPEDRQIGPGKTETLELEFQANASVDQGEYSIVVTFAEGQSVASAPCSVIAEDDPSYDHENLEWTLTNTSHTDVVLESLSIAWPTENGVIEQVFFGLDPIFISEPLPLETFGGKNDGSRRVWTGYLDQPAASILRVDEAQGAHKGYATVAVIDTGVDPDHWLLAGALVPGYDFLRDEAGYGSEVEALLDQSVMAILDGSGSLPLDGDGLVQLNQSVMAILDGEQAAELSAATLPPAFGHGTMVAGVIHRVAPYASIMPLRVFDLDGYADLLDIVEAIYFAVDHGANVINMSFNVESFSAELMRAINYAARHGVSCIASAGNHGQEKIVYPAAFGSAVGVAASSLGDEVSLFSNLGNDLVTVSAPGEAVVTTFPGGGWALASGTSFAAPWISGANAIFADKNGHEHQPGRADFFLASEALSHAVPVKGHGAGRAGHGRADLKEAVDKLKDGAAVGTTGVAEYPYVIRVDFAEGCSVAYPPADAGFGCAAEGSHQLEVDDDKITLAIANAGFATIEIARIEVSWPAEHEALEKVKLGGDTIFEIKLLPTSAVIDSGWKDPDDRKKRQIEPSDTLELRFEFAEKLSS